MKAWAPMLQTYAPMHGLDTLTLVRLYGRSLPSRPLSEAFSLNV